MHHYQCSTCFMVIPSHIAPRYGPSNRPDLPDWVPVHCDMHPGHWMYYMGFFPQGPVYQPPAQAQFPAQVRPPPQPQKPVGHAVVPAPLRPQVQDLPIDAYRDVWLRILASLPLQDILMFRLLSRGHRDLAERIMKGWFSPKSLSYNASGGVQGNMRHFIQQTIAHQKEVRISVDQLTDPKLLTGLLSHRAAVVGINAGRLASGKDRRGTFGTYDRNATVITLPGNAKMHNKFLVLGGQGVVTGSANLSYKGLNDNQECAVVIRHPLVMMLFREYFERMKAGPNANRHHQAAAPAPNMLTDQNFTGQIQRFNTDNRVRVALAPFLNIRDFVYEELQRAHGGEGVRITMRQFVVDQPTDNQRDILKALIALKQAGAEVSVVLDAGQYEAASYVRRACAALRGANIDVYLQQTGKNIMHEKLLLLEFTRNERTTKTVMIGSAGFTRNVSENLNYENIVAIDEDGIYDYFMQWHTHSLTARSAQTNLRLE